jgi:hypothetical protein
MCQAYEAERTAICSSERTAECYGFSAALQGKPKEENPYRRVRIFAYEADAWDHGWECFQMPNRIFPLGVEHVVDERSQASSFVERTKVRREYESAFRLKGEIPEWLRDVLLTRYGQKAAY